MKRMIVLIALVMLVTAAHCQKDSEFNKIVTFKQGIRFGDNSLQTTAATGSGTVTWDAVSGKPTLFPPAAHNHDLLYRPIAWLPTFAQVTGKPTTLAGYGITDAASVIHTHSLMYKPIDYVPAWNEVINKPVFAAVATTGSYNDLANKPETQELATALPELPGIRLPVLTQTQINALVPVKGLIVFNDTDGVLQIWNGLVWKIIITSNN